MSVCQSVPAYFVNFHFFSNFSASFFTSPIPAPLFSISSQLRFSLHNRSHSKLPGSANLTIPNPLTLANLEVHCQVNNCLFHNKWEQRQLFCGGGPLGQCMGVDSTNKHKPKEIFSRGQCRMVPAGAVLNDLLRIAPLGGLR